MIDLESEKVVNNIPVGFGPRAVISDLDGKYLSVSEEASNSVGIIDRKSYKEVKRIQVGGTPRGMDIDPETNHLLISCFERVLSFTASGQVPTSYNESVSVIDLNTLTHIGSLPSGLGACSLKIFNTSKPEFYFENSFTLTPELATV